MSDAFARLAGDELVWLPSRGIGYLPVHSAPYDAAYFQKYVRYAATDMGRAITAERVRLVERHAGYGADIVDVGIGCGAFCEAMNCAGYDISPVALAWLGENGRFRDPVEQPADALTFWDVLEHISRPERILDCARRWVFVSAPIVPGNGPPRTDWRHYRPSEHCWYWTRNGLIAFMAEYGFTCVEHGTPESLLGREDIHTFAFKRVSANEKREAA